MAVFRTPRDRRESHDLGVRELKRASLTEQHVHARRTGAARHRALRGERRDARE
jgi:hypothetical protein